MEANEVRVLKKNPDKITRLWFELIPDLWCEHREHGRRFVFLQCLLSHHRGFRIKTCSMLLPTFTTRGGYCSDPLGFFPSINYKWIFFSVNTSNLICSLRCNSFECPVRDDGRWCCSSCILLSSLKSTSWCIQLWPSQGCVHATWL